MCVVTSAFDEVMRNAYRNEQGRRIESELDRLQQASIVTLADQLNGKNPRRVRWKQAATPYRALAALRLGLITKEQFATVCCFCAARQHEGASIWIRTPLFRVDGTLTARAKRVMRANWKQTREATTDWKSVRDRLCEHMKTRPYSEQQFYLTEQKHSEDLYGRIVKIGAGVFGPCGRGWRMIASVGMQQAFLEARYGASAVVLHPVIGVSETGDIRENGLKHTRDVSLWMPAHPLPAEADGMQVSRPVDFSYHDFYHAQLCSSIPPMYRAVLVQLADLFLKAGRRHADCPRAQTFFQTMQNRLIDMEYPLVGGGDARSRLQAQIVRDIRASLWEARLMSVAGLDRRIDEAKLRRALQRMVASNLPSLHRLQHALHLTHSCALQLLLGRR